MASVASQLIEEVTAHAQSDSLEDAWEICTDSTYFPNNLRSYCEDWYNEVSNLYACQYTLLQRKKFFLFAVYFSFPLPLFLFILHMSLLNVLNRNVCVCALSLMIP